RLSTSPPPPAPTWCGLWKICYVFLKARQRKPSTAWATTSNSIAASMTAAGVSPICGSSACGSTWCPSDPIEIKRYIAHNIIVNTTNKLHMERYGMRFKRLLMCSSLAVAIAGMAIPSHAQIEEIVVTARKTSESLQSTPVAVTALNEIMLAQAQVTELSD